ncbi:DUF4342 domain-containing protein [Anthocerotibacter panamensis]|uniref:DUF4342 domain-containing protein n=1 Tax=Anthocerotibacter panamensis TaxID=2857077 RepID=UPI001C404624|nr:DUF4342 domain-containing protein [Anthocerotibacter panamensis]
MASPIPRTFLEEVNVAGHQLVDKSKELIAKGNVRRFILKDSTGTRTLLEVPLTLGVAAGAGLTLFAPFLVTIGALAALLTQAKVIIERYENPEDAEQESQTSLLERGDD